MGSPATYFINTSNLRYVGLYEEHEVLAGLRDASFEPDWLALKNASSQTNALREPPGQGTWMRLAVLFPDFESLPPTVPTTQPAPEAAPIAREVPAPQPATVASPSRRGLKSRCKKCGAEISFFAALCKPCEKEVQTARLANAKKREEEKKRLDLEQRSRNTECVRNTLEQVLHSITSETPVGYVFVHWNVTQKGGSGGTGGAIVGGLLGGMVGAMIGSALTSGKGGISGELGVMVVTPDRILIHHFTSAFLSLDGNIGHPHLIQLSRAISTKAAASLTFDIRQTQLVPTQGAAITLVCGDKQYRLQKSDLIVNDAPFALASLEEIRKVAMTAGALVSPAQFIDALRLGANPMPDSQLSEIKGDSKYFAQVCALLIRHRERDLIHANFAKLTPALRERLESPLKHRASLKTTTWSVLSGCLIIGGMAVFGIFFAHDFLLFLSWVAALTMAGLSVATAIELRRINWCRRVTASETKQ